MGALQRKSATIVFTDIVGYSATSHRDEALALELLDEHNRLVRLIVGRHAGREIKTIGDAFLLAFESSGPAIDCAVELQEAFGRRNRDLPPARRIEIRIGVNVGDIVERDGDVFGDGVNIAARLVNVAVGGEICFSAAVMAQVAHRLPGRARSLGALRLKNIDTPIQTYRLGKGRRPWKVPRAIWRAAMATAAGLALYFNASPPNDRLVAVLPFANAGELDFSDEIIRSLTRVPGLQVLAADTARALAAGKRLHEGKVVSGELTRHGDRVVVEARIVDAAKDVYLWTRRFEGTVSDLFRIQNEIAAAAGGVMSPARTLAGEPPREAYLAYLRGRQALNLRTHKGMIDAIAAFRAATAIDPSFAPAFDAEAKAYFLLAFYGHLSPEDAFRRGSDAADRALTLDPHATESHIFISMKKVVFDHDWVGAEAALREAIETAPGAASAHQWYANLLAVTGRFEEAKIESAKAVALDPLSLKMQLSSGAMYAHAREDARAAAIFRNILAMDPKHPFARFSLGLARFQLGEREAAIAELRRADTLAGRPTVTRAALGYALGKAGHAADAETILSELRAREGFVPRYQIAETLVGLGRLDEGIAELSAAVDAHELFVIFLRVNPMFDELHAKPAFRKLLRRIGL